MMLAYDGHGLRTLLNQHGRIRTAGLQKYRVCTESDAATELITEV